MQNSNTTKYGEISKWGRLRPPPVADEGSKKEWQRSKFCEADSEQKISGTATGHNGADSKGSRAHHSATCESSCFLAISRKCFIFLEFWMTAFQLRPVKSRAKFKTKSNFCLLSTGEPRYVLLRYPKFFARCSLRKISTAATPFCSLSLPPAALANVPTSISLRI